MGCRTEEIDLSALSDEDLVKQMHDDLYDGLAPEIVEGTNILLGRGWGAERVLNEALVEGMRIVGIDFRDCILFFPEVLLAANAMKAGIEILRPLLSETGARGMGKVVIGTVKGDIHDIGKNLVRKHANDVHIGGTSTVFAPAPACRSEAAARSRRRRSPTRRPRTRARTRCSRRSSPG
jgi:methanogenic corrinoid protein MtbC1